MAEINNLPKNATFTEKVMFGLRKALRKLAEEAAANNETLVIGERDGSVKRVPAKELLKTLPKK